MKIVYADMIGDMFHRGHVNFIRRLTELGDKVIIGVTSDKSCESYKRTPICTLEERLSVIEACKYVDEVIPDAPLVVTKEFMNEHGIDLVVHAHDENDHSQDEFFAIPVSLGKFKRLNYTKGVSTTEIIKRCKKSK